ncbi:MAG: tyrosine-type recombinase/integrase [Candidatus Dojkabacteria bacterium]|nr:MAG: tyrosine-type recombinase/integrase [Candidatus Dojkabacteria bacterium]
MDIPKLPEQDDFLLDLQNNNYSMLTVYNYARDLCIFAVFLNGQKIKFDEVDKKTITIYKGYLRNGDHLVDLNQFREEYLNKAFDIKDNDMTRSKGSKTDDTDQGATDTPGELSKDEEQLERIMFEGRLPGRSDHSQGRTTQTYLDDVYKKVFGSLKELKPPTRNRGNKEQGLDARSVNRMLSAIRSYLKYRIDFDLDIPIAPDAIKLIKADRKKSQVAEFDELVKLIECPTEFERDLKVALRNRTMMEMLFSTGMRISELTGLNLEQINLDGKLFIEGKGRKQRFVYLTDRAKDWLNEYLKIRLNYVGYNGSAEGLEDMSNDPNWVVNLLTDNNVEISDKSGAGGSDAESAADQIEADPGDSTSDRETSEDSSVSRSGLDGFDRNKLSADGKGIELVEQYRRTGYLKKFYSPALFIPFSGGRNGRRGKRISTNYFQEKIAEYRRRIGIQVPTSAHSSEAWLCNLLWLRMVLLQRRFRCCLGHESLNTTTRYVHASDRFAEEEHTSKHPLK